MAIAFFFFLFNASMPSSDSTSNTFGQGDFDSSESLRRQQSPRRRLKWGFERLASKIRRNQLLDLCNKKQTDVFQWRQGRGQHTTWVIINLRQRDTLDFFKSRRIRFCSSSRYLRPVDPTTSKMCGRSCTPDGSDTAAFL